MTIKMPNGSQKINFENRESTCLWKASPEYLAHIKSSRPMLNGRLVLILSFSPSSASRKQRTSKCIAPHSSMSPGTPKPGLWMQQLKGLSDRIDMHSEDINSTCWRRAYEQLGVDVFRKTRIGGEHWARFPSTNRRWGPERKLRGKWWVRKEERLNAQPLFKYLHIKGGWREAPVKMLMKHQTIALN